MSEPINARVSELQIHTRKAAPKLKSGIRYWRSEITHQLQIGSRFSNYLLPNQIGTMELEPLLALLANGKLQKNRETQDLLSILEDLSLLDLEETEIDYRYGEDESRNIAAAIQRSVAQESFLSRIRIESDGITRMPKLKDGGVRKVLERREFAIQIYGAGRIAFALLGTLIASGFDLAEIVEDIEVKGKDVIGGCVSKREVGLAARLKTDELLNGSSLYPEPLRVLKRADLIISIGPPLPEVLQEWNRERISQLFIDFDNAGEFRIGPYVQPGSSACYNCVNIGENEGGLPSKIKLNTPLLSNDVDLTAGLATFCAGIVTLAITQIADTGSSDLHEKSALYSSLKFLEPQITSWGRSPRCGCNWI